MGIRVPNLRRLARQYRTLSLQDTKRLLKSPLHEERLTALLILVQQFTRGDDATRERIYNLYLASTRYINNWDLVDTSAEHIVGAYLFQKDHSPLSQLADSPSLWERRIAIMSTFHFIRKRKFDTTLHIAGKLLTDRHDLIHKAVGWMLREIGNRDPAAAETFLIQHHRTMPRTMLRYAIERLPEPQRRAYLAGKAQRV